ncbi:MAG: hypothetical protein Q8Q18_00385 [bacterium]|nr:hypothetical protein [bacterium]
MVLVPWVAVCFVVIVAALRYRLFLEALVAGFIFDVWFGGANAHYGIFTALIILVAAELITRFLGVRRA